MNEWIYCKDKMPGNKGKILFCTDKPDGQFVYAGYYFGRTWHDPDGNEYIFPNNVAIYAWAYWPHPAPLPEVQPKAALNREGPMPVLTEIEDPDDPETIIGHEATW